MPNQAKHLADEIQRFLKSPTAHRIAAGSGADPLDAQGALYIRLAPALRNPVHNLGAYVRKYGPHHLRSYLRAERQMRPLQEDAV